MAFDSMFLQLTGWPIFILSILALLGIEDCRCYNIHVFHLIDNPLWGETDGTALEGTFQCPTLVSTSDANTSSSCTFVSTDPKGVPADRLMDNLVSKYRRYLSSPASTSALAFLITQTPQQGMAGCTMTIRARR